MMQPVHSTDVPHLSARLPNSGCASGIQNKVTMPTAAATTPNAEL